MGRVRAGWGWIKEQGGHPVDVDTRVRAIVYVAGIWGGAIAPVFFLLYYTWVCNWWENPTGRTLAALDLCILALRADRLSQAFHHHHAVSLRPGDWLVAIVNLAIPLVILYRIGAFESKRRMLKRQARQSAETLRLVTMRTVP
jgi:hypothetical protein